MKATPAKRRPTPLPIMDEEARAGWRSLIRREVLRLARRGDKVRPELLRWAKEQE